MAPIQGMSARGPKPEFAAVQDVASNGRLSGLSSDVASTAVPDPVPSRPDVVCLTARRGPEALGEGCMRRRIAEQAQKRGQSAAEPFDGCAIKGIR
jgi:hypothetical protein